MLDFHSHILPHIDDGSSSTAESIEMLSMLRTQGVDTVIATPHFYPQEQELAAFLENRNNAFRHLMSRIPEETEIPEIRLGAEVYYYQGISRLENLRSLRIDGSKLLLLEMPMMTWNDYMVGELVDLSCYGNIRIVMAHIERFLSLQKRGVFEKLLSRGILIQTNASAFLSHSSRRRALKMLKEHKIDFIGTDCHNVHERKPRMDEATEVITSKFGADFLKNFDDSSRRYLDTLK